MPRRFLPLFSLALLLAPGLPAEPSLSNAAPPSDPVTASLIAETRGFTPGQALTVALSLKMAPGWHSYWRDPGDAGLATEVTWRLPKGVKAGPLLWPKPSVFKDPGGLVGYGYEGRALIFTEIQVPKDYQGERLALDAQANWLACHDVCIPGNAGVSLVLANLDPNLPSAAAPLFDLVRPSLGQEPDGYHAAKGAAAPGGAVAPKPRLTMVPDDQLQGFEQAPAAPAANLLWMLLLAFAGGLLLNLMPCVLPVLSLKALSFVEQSQQGRGHGLRLALAFAAGVLSSFWALAALVLALKHGGNAVGWGFQFQEPAFVLGMASVVLAFSLNLFGVFEVWLPGGATQGLHKASQGQGLTGSFGHGLVMTLLATPCTAPFLGTALGFAFAAGSAQLLAVFTAVALGLALPYVLLAAWPGSRAWLPKPGNWMLRFKEAMGFLLLATVVWLLWLLGKQVGVDAQGWGMVWLLALGGAGWAWGHFGGPGKARVALLLLPVLVLAGWWLLPKALQGGGGLAERTDLTWATWDQGQVDSLHAKGQPVFVDFGADWCWTCRVNERDTLADKAVLKAFADHNVALFKADWTRRDPAITEALRSHGRSGVPMYVYYPGQGDPQVLPELLTPGRVLALLDSGAAMPPQ